MLIAKFDEEKGCLKIKRISPEDFYKNKNEEDEEDEEDEKE